MGYKIKFSRIACAECRLLAKYKSLWGTLYAVGIIMILIPVSIIFFKYGLWLSFAIPWAAIQLRQMIDF